MTGSPTKPNDIIEKWVSDSHNYTWKLSLLKKICEHSVILFGAKGGRTAGGEWHNDCTECHHKGECWQVGPIEFIFYQHNQHVFMFFYVCHKKAQVDL